jgi:DNA polymerase-1
LRGDPSDRLPGAPGLGAGGAAALLERYGSPEAALKAGRYSSHQHELLLFKIDCHDGPQAPLPQLHNQTPTWPQAAALARKWDLKQLAGHLENYDVQID